MKPIREWQFEAAVEPCGAVVRSAWLRGVLSVATAAACLGFTSAWAAQPPILWQNETTQGFEIAAEVAAGEGRVATVGEHFSRPCVTGSCGIDASLRVYDAATGALLWTSNYDFNRSFDTNNAVAITDHVVITAGYSQNVIRTFGHAWWVVSAFDLDSGTLLWRDVLGDQFTDYFPWQIAVKGRRAYVTGPGGATCVTGADSLSCDQVTRAYDVHTGEVIWTIREDVRGGDDETLSVAAHGKMIYLGGCVGKGPSDPGIQPDVRAYDAISGRLVWEDVIDDPLQDGFVFKVVAQGDRVVAAAVSNDDWLVRAYDAHTGVTLWSKTYSRLGSSVARMFDAPVQLSMGEDVILVGGYGSTQVFGTERYPKASRDWVVNAYDAKNGRLLWSDVSGSPTDIDEVDGGVILAHGQAFALGFVTGTDGRTHTLVRAYNARTGKLRWQDEVDRPGLPFGVTITLAEADGRLSAASFVQGTRPPGTPFPEAYGYNLLVRTYDVRGDDDDGADRGERNDPE